MTAYQLHYYDCLRLEYEGAFANRVAKAVDKSGKKYQFKEVSDYINFEKIENEILGYEQPKKKEVDKDLIKNIAKINQKGG